MRRGPARENTQDCNHSNIQVISETIPWDFCVLVAFSYYSWQPRMEFCECGNRPEKSIQNQSKMMPGRCLGDTRSLPGASRGSVRAAFSDAIENTRKFECFWEPPRTSREAPGDPEGHQKSIKNRLFGEKKAFQTWLIAFFVCTTQCSTCFVQFRFDCSLKSMKKQRGKEMYNFIAALVFWTWRPSRNIVFYDTKATFCFF